jgi:hypothetical protein
MSKIQQELTIRGAGASLLSLQNEYECCESACHHDDKYQDNHLKKSTGLFWLTVLKATVHGQ